jgi:hypothetical protein
MDAVENEEDDSCRNKAEEDGALSEEDIQPPSEPQIKKVSDTVSALIFCHKQFLLKLLFEGDVPVLFEHSSVK